MAKKARSEEQILRALHQAEGGERVTDICRERGVSEATFPRVEKEIQWLGRRVWVSPHVYPISDTLHESSLPEFGSCRDIPTV
jgi:hypothetical protein